MNTEDISNIILEKIPITDENKSRNDGKWCKIFREARGIKQFIIANELRVSQQRVSKLETYKVLDDKILEVYGKICNIDPELIKQLTNADESIVYTFSDHAQQNNSECEQYLAETINFNPIDKVMDLCANNAITYQQLVETERTHKEEYKKLFEDSLNRIKELTETISKLNHQEICASIPKSQ